MNTIRQVLCGGCSTVHPMMDCGQYEVMVTHPNGEDKWLPVESWHERWISVRWGLSGTYDLMLKDGRMVARNTKARTKHPQNPWTAKDFKELRVFVSEKMGMTREDLEARFEHHHRSMPDVQRAKISIQDIKREYLKK